MRGRGRVAARKADEAEGGWRGCARRGARGGLRPLLACGRKRQPQRTGGQQDEAAQHRFDYVDPAEQRGELAARDVRAMR